MVKFEQADWSRLLSLSAMALALTACGGSGGEPRGGTLAPTGTDSSAASSNATSAASRAYMASVATVGGGARLQPVQTAAGGVVAGWLNEVGAFVEFTVDGGTGGSRRISLRYANGNPDTRNVSLYLNGATVTQLELPSTGSWTSFTDSASVEVILGAGPNRVRLQRDVSDRPSADINLLQVSGFGQAAALAPAPTPAAPAPAAAGPAPDNRLLAAPRPGSANRDIQVTGEMPRSSDVGAFRTVCTFSHFNYDDPLVFPGQQNATHLHMFFGNTGTNFASTPQTIATTGNSTCRGGIVNRSAYWVPALLDTRSGAPVVPDLINVYYKSGYYGVRPSDVRSWPDGFRMIAGNSKSTGAQSEVISYRCNSGPSQNFIPQCSGVLTMSVRFQQCWDGRNLTSPDHMSHVRHPNPGEGCNRPGEVATPELSMNIDYPVDGGVNYRLSSDVTGAPPGSSGHADWMKGWEPGIMQTFVSRVINPSLDGGSHIVGDGRAIGCGYPGCR